MVAEVKVGVTVATIFSPPEGVTCIVVGTTWGFDVDDDDDDDDNGNDDGNDVDDGNDDCNADDDDGCDAAAGDDFEDATLEAITFVMV